MNVDHCAMRIGGPTRHFWSKTLISTLHTFFGLPEFLHRANRQKSHISHYSKLPIEPNGLNSLILRNVAPSIHGNPVFVQHYSMVGNFVDSLTLADFALKSPQWRSHTDMFPKSNPQQYY